MTRFLNESYTSFELLEWDVEETSKKDGFKVIKKNTSYSSEKILLKGAFRCYKCGSSGTKATDFLEAALLMKTIFSL